MKVLVAGANGQTGRLIIEQLAHKTDHHPYAMIRDEAQSKALMEIGAVEVIVADLKDALTKITEGMDAVIFAAGSGSETGQDQTIEIDQEGAKKLIDAAKTDGVKHFIMLSSMGADEPQGPLEHYLAAKRVADDYLVNSGLTYTIVRPGPLSNDEATGKVEAAEKVEFMEERSIPRADVARVLVESLEYDNLKNKIIEVIDGDQNITDVLSVYS